MADALKKSKTATPKTGDASPAHHARAEDAAQLLGQDSGAFAATPSNERAQATIGREARIMMSERDFARFMGPLDNPEPPNNCLKVAAEEYKAVRHQHPELNW